MAATEVARQPRTDSHPPARHARTSWLWPAPVYCLFTTFQMVIPDAAQDVLAAA